MDEIFCNARYYNCEIVKWNIHKLLNLNYKNNCWVLWQKLEFQGNIITSNIILLILKIFDYTHIT